MFRNQYDTDVTTFSPQGRLHQVEYACEAVKQGSAVVGITSKTHVVLSALRRSPGDLASYQKKLFRIDDHMGIGISGLVADARALCEYMREESLNHKYVFGSPVDTGRLVTSISEKAQVYTQSTEKRPYGVGLLVAGYNEKLGARLYETSPAGIHYQFIAQSIGARSQACKTYLEKHQESFPDATADELIVHAAKALQGAAQTAKEYSADAVSILIVGKDTPLRILSHDEVGKLLAAVPEPAGGYAAGDVKEPEEGDAEEPEPERPPHAEEEDGRRMDLD
jgi:20S proteasome subunit alpha 6